jgi:L-iditol 2-dehydrogenase
MSMKNHAAVLYAPRDIRVEQRPVPKPGRGEVLIEVKAVGVCGSDVHWYEHGKIGPYVVREPLILGHEAAGVIVDVGEGTPKNRIGQRVTIEPGIPDGICEQCRAGRYNLCPNVRFFATPPIDGAFTNYVTLPGDFAYALPDGMTDEEGAMMEPVSVCLWACRKAQLQGGDHVLITGAGPIGLITMKVAFALGATQVTITDILPQRLEAARKLGATRTVNVAEEPLASAKLEADILIECSGNETALIDGVRSLRPAGRAIVVGMNASEELRVPMFLIQEREILLTGTFRYANTYTDAIALVASGRVELKSLITGHFTLEETEKALRDAEQNPAGIKPVVLPGWSR